MKTTSHQLFLKYLAAKYIWWRTPDEALRWPDRVVSQVIELGETDVMQQFKTCLMATKLKVILQRIEAKDYLDVTAMIKDGVCLSHGLAAGQIEVAPPDQQRSRSKIAKQCREFGQEKEVIQPC